MHGGRLSRRVAPITGRAGRDGRGEDRDGRRGVRVARRRFLGGFAASSVALAAGCIGSDDDPGEDGEPGEDEEPIDPDLDLGERVLSSNQPFELVEPDVGERTGPIVSTDVVASVHWPHDPPVWHHAPLMLPYKEMRTLRARVVDAEGEEIPVGEGETYRVTVATTETTPDDLVEIEIRGGFVDCYGTNTGTGALEFALRRDDDPVWEAPPLEVRVTHFG